jgi:hypothetical protein
MRVRVRVRVDSNFEHHRPSLVLVGLFRTLQTKHHPPRPQTPRVSIDMTFRSEFASNRLFERRFVCVCVCVCVCFGTVTCGSYERGYSAHTRTVTNERFARVKERIRVRVSG